jgi:hypothetical protein
MSADLLLSKLDKVRRTGNGTWSACCPAHNDKSPSLSIRETDTGSILLHCFSGCTAHEIVAAVGMELSDLFPPRTDQHFVKGERRPFPAADCLRAIAFESSLVLIAAADLLAGNPFNETDRARLALAVARIQSALTAGGIRQ